MEFHWIFCPRYSLPPYRRPWEGANNTREDLFEKGSGLPAFCRRFTRKETLKGCVIYATALGIFELYCNGERVGESTPNGVVYDELKPGTTDYRQRVHLFTYDLLPYLQRENKIVAIVAPGWWSGRISFGAFGLQPPAFAANIVLTYQDGTQEVIHTGDGWESAVVGPTLSSDMYDGEYTDGRMPPPQGEWEAYDWEPAAPFSYKGKVEPLNGPPVRIRHDLTRYPISATLYRGIEDNGTRYGAMKPLVKRVGKGCEHMTVRPGEVLVLDLGQNIAGKPWFSLNAKSGTTVTVHMGEMLNDTGDLARGNDGPKGSLYLANYRTAHSRLAYVAKGATGESHMPMYLYYGFRYLEISADQEVEIVSLKGLVMTSYMKETGSLTTNHPLVNQLISNIEWGRRGNYLSTATDCPQRDERLGWSGDTHIFAGAAAYLADIRGFMGKWLEDARDSQIEHHGAFADVVPTVLSPLSDGFAGTAGWGDAGIVLPGILWRFYGDKKTMQVHYPAMETYMEYLSQFGYEGGGLNYGDWLSYETTDKRYIAVAYYAYDARLMADYSRILSEGPGDFFSKRAVYYEELYLNIRLHFRNRYVKEGRLIETSQTAYLLALRFGLLEEDEIEMAKTSLIRAIKDNANKLSTGFLGTGILVQTLSQIGEDEMAYRLLTATHNPSWLYSVKQGATTVWERWNSYTKEGGFGDVSMNSFNHYAYGAVLEWMYHTMAGIQTDPEKAGFEHVVLAPKPDTRPDAKDPITHVKAAYDSVRGTIRSEWYYVDGNFTWEFTVPQGVTATVRFPLMQGRTPQTSTRGVVLNHVPYTVGELCGTVKGCTLEFTLPGGDYVIQNSQGD